MGMLFTDTNMQFKFIAVFSLLTGAFGAATKFDSQQMTALTSGQAISQGELLYKLTKSGEVISETKQHFEYLATAQNVTALERRTFSYSRDCNGHFGRWEHDDLQSSFNSAVEAFWKPQDQSVTVAAFVSGNHVTACVKLHCYGCTSLDALKGLAYQAWSYSTQNKCDQNETQGSDAPQCRCHMDYSWGSGCPSAGTYWG